jgi:hypothetical protein
MARSWASSANAGTMFAAPKARPAVTPVEPIKNERRLTCMINPPLSIALPSSNSVDGHFED